MTKAILLDIDGTLTNDEKKITPRTRDALLAAQGRGARLALASGRTEQGLAQFASQLEMFSHHGILVCYNGAKAVDCQTGETLFSRPLAVEDARAVLEHMKGFDVAPVIDRGAYMYVNDVYGGVIRTEEEPFSLVRYESRGNGYLLCEQADLAAFVDFPVYKVLNAGQPEYLQEHWREMAAPFEGRLSSMFTAPYYYEFTALGVDKAEAIRQSFARADIPLEDVVAFGDAQNDASMLSLVGTGVAMGNAVEETKVAADLVTLSNNEDGIAWALERLL